MNFLANIAAGFLGKYFLANVSRFPGLIDRAVSKKSDVVAEWRDLLLDVRPKIAALAERSAQFFGG